jgi:hypothetical protein
MKNKQKEWHHATKPLTFNLKKLYGQQAYCSGIYSGIFCP